MAFRWTSSLVATDPNSLHPGLDPSPATIESHANRGVSLLVSIAKLRRTSLSLTSLYGRVCGRRCGGYRLQPVLSIPPAISSSPRVQIFPMS
jgi:hypothetical protein